MGYKETLLFIIKNKGNCFAIDCRICPIRSECREINCSDYITANKKLNEMTYQMCMKKYIELYGEEDLMEALL